MEHVAQILHPLGSEHEYVAALNLISYIDDSGSHKDSRVFVLGGCVAPAKEWSLWYPQWRSVLLNEGPKPAQYFHAKECVHSGGEFRGWGKEEANLFPLKLIPVIDRRRMFKVCAAVVMDDFHEIVKGDLLKQYRSPYYLCMLSCVSSIAGFLSRQPGVPRKERVGYVFEEQNEFAELAMRIYGWVKTAKNNERQYKMGPAAFDSKAGSPMLQAADLVAFETYSHMLEKLGIRKQEYPQRFDALSKLNFVGNYYDRRKLETLPDPTTYPDWNPNWSIDDPD